MKIISIEEGKKDKNGNDMKIVTMENKTKLFVNSKYESEIFAAVSLEKDIEIVEDGKFWRIMPESLGIQPKPKTNYKTGQITEAVKIKSESIAKAQENRNDSIRMSSACRDATLMITTFVPIQRGSNLEDEELKKKWLEWRKFFFERLGDNPKDFSQPF